MAKNRDYQFIESTISLCPECLGRIEGKIILKGNKIFVSKTCKEHGYFEEIMEENADYYLGRMLYNKPGSLCKTQSKSTMNCPYDCGLCPDHEQHTCIGLIEVTNDCDLKCPVCYAHSGSGKPVSLVDIDKMLDLYLDSEYGEAEILQISGGEPTTHPDIIKIIKRARQKVKYVMLNTNGLRVAEDEEFVKELAQFKGGFEIYLQFDGFDDKTYKHFRGRPLIDVKTKAIDNLTKYQIPITLVSTIERGINDHEIGRIVEFGINSKYIRGINFQPVAFFGRLNGVKRNNRITITGVINEIEKQTKELIRKSDFIPLPCNVDRVAVTYLYKNNDEFIPLMRNMDLQKYVPIIRNTFKFDPEDFVKDLTKSAFCTTGSCCNYLGLLGDFYKIVPKSYFRKSQEEKIEYVSENTFRISVTSFVDAYNFDMKSMKKECVHVITPDLKKIPFSSFNIIHRGKYE